MHEKGFYEMRLTMEFSAGVKKIKTFLKNALVFDMEFYFGHIIIHTYVRTSLYVCITTFFWGGLTRIK